jgi:hypothetical protein
MECSSILPLEVNVCDMNGHDDTTLSKDLNLAVHPSLISFEPGCRSCSLLSPVQRDASRYPTRLALSSQAVSFIEHGSDEASVS